MLQWKIFWKKRINVKKIKIKYKPFNLKQLQNCKFWSQKLQYFLLMKRYFLFSFIKYIRRYKRKRVWGNGRDIYCFQKPRFLGEKRFASKHVNIVALWSLPADSLKILKRYIDIFKKKLSLIFFYSPF